MMGFWREYVIHSPLTILIRYTNYTLFIQYIIIKKFKTIDFYTEQPLDPTIDLWGAKTLNPDD